MVNVAVAGGTGKVGKTIVEVLKANPKHKVFILSRETSGKVGESDVPLIRVDYNSGDCMKDALEHNQIHTINLIYAAAHSSVTERFALSEWGSQYPIEAIQYMPHLKFRIEATEEIKKTSLQWTRFFTGYFLDFYGPPYIKSYLQPVAFVLDMPNKTAAIPATGNELVSFTYTFDVGKFVVTALDLPEWPQESMIIGDKITWNEFVKLAEAARGRSFTINYDDLEKLKTSQVTELPSHVPVYPFFPKEKLQHVFAVFGQWVAAGFFDLPVENSLNAKFPDIKTLTVKEMLDQTWKGK
ncbi:NAD(P)-binding protein [Cadophora sp. DSE1049]|nr:NAD(P)-binding protein [Cadophora sp. DSE1049]